MYKEREQKGPFHTASLPLLTAEHQSIAPSELAAESSS